MKRKEQVKDVREILENPKKLEEWARRMIEGMEKRRR